jgi:hypothetical protein
MKPFLLFNFNTDSELKLVQIYLVTVGYRLRITNYARLVFVSSCPCAQVIKHYAMKAYEGVDVYIHIFLTSALVGGEWSASRPCRFTPRLKSPRYPLDRRLSEPQNRAGRCGEEKILYSVQTGSRYRCLIHVLLLAPLQDVRKDFQSPTPTILILKTETAVIAETLKGQHSTLGTHEFHAIYLM